MSRCYIEEAGCAVCGELKPLSVMSRLKSVKNLLHILVNPGVTCKERILLHQFKNFPVQCLITSAIEFVTNAIRPYVQIKYLDWLWPTICGSAKYQRNSNALDLLKKSLLLMFAIPVALLRLHQA